MESQKTVLIKALPEGNLVQHTLLWSLAADPDKSGQAVRLAGFAPALALSFHDSEYARKPPNALSLSR